MGRRVAVLACGAGAAWGQALAWLAAHARPPALRGHGVCPKASVTVRSSPEAAGPKGSTHMHSGA